MTTTVREIYLAKVLLRSAQKMMAMALGLEALETNNGWDAPAIQIRAEAAIAFEALQKEFD